MVKLEGEFHFDTGINEASQNEPESGQTNSEKSSSQGEKVETPPPHLASARQMHVPVRKKIKFFSSLSEYPLGVSFDSQDSDEEIVLLLRRSFFTNIPWIFSIALAALIPPILVLLPLPSFFGGLSTLTYIILLVFFYLILFGGVLVNFALWYFHVGLVTNKRIIDVDLHGILSRHVAETRISLVQDVSYQQIGFLRSLFHFGNVYVQTAGSEQNFEFDRVPRPQFVAQVVGDLLGRPYHKRNK